MSEQRYAIGIDLGSTLCEVAVMEGGKPVIIPSKEGNNTFPSVVYINDNDERICGEPAKRQMVMHKDQAIYLIKRLIGRTYEEAKEAISHNFGYEVVNKNGYPYVKVNGKEYSPQEVSSWLISALKQQAEDYIGHTVTDAVITVPALFDNTQKAATKEAGELAGLNVLRIISEPTAAFLASNIEDSGKYMVVDFGGSTTDVTVLDYDKNTNIIDVRSSFGDTWLGGADLDNALTDYIVSEFYKQNNVDLSKDPMAMQRIKKAAEDAKIALSNNSSTDVIEAYITQVDNKPLNLQQTISRAKFEQLAEPFIARVIDCGKKSLQKAELDSVDGIILVGGSCRIPKVQEELKRNFNAPLIQRAHLDLAVAEGAAKQANILVGNVSDSDTLLLDVTPISLGIVTNGEINTTIIEANTTIPVRKTQVFTTAADNQPAVEIVVVQGERPMAKDNKVIGRFILDGIAPAPRGIPQIEVTFEQDANAILNVTAKDKATNKEQHITITEGNSLSKEEVERIKRDAEEHKAEDDKKREELEKINAAETYLYGMRNSVKDENLGSKMTDDEKKRLNDLLDDLDEAVKTRDLTKIEPAQKAVEDVFGPIAQRIYAEGQPQAGGEGQPNPNPFAGTDSPFANADFTQVNPDNVAEVKAEDVTADNEKK